MTIQISGSLVEGIGNERIDGRVPNSRIKMIFCVAGFRPGGRGPFVSAKGPKTNDAPSGERNGRTPMFRGRTNSLHSNKARPARMASSVSQTAGVGAGETNQFRVSHERAPISPAKISQYFMTKRAGQKDQPKTSDKLTYFFTCLRISRRPFQSVRMWPAVL